MARILTLLLMIMYAGPALSQEEACSGVVSRAAMLFEVRAIEDALRRMDPDEARYRIRLVHPQWACLMEPAHPSELALYMRLRSIMGFLDQDETQLLQWGQAAALADPALGWFADIHPGHPIRSSLDEAEEIRHVVRTDASLVVPRKGAGHGLAVEFRYCRRHFANGHQIPGGQCSVELTRVNSMGG